MNPIPGRRCSNVCICDLNFPFEILLWQTSVYLERIVFLTPLPSSLSFNTSIHRSVNVNIQSHLCCATWYLQTTG